MTPSTASGGRRWPLVVVMVIALVAGVVVQQRRDDRPEPVTAPTASQMMPTASAGALSSTWYCAGGTATGKASGAAEQTVVIQNASDQTSTGSVEAMTDQGKTASKSITVAAHDHVDVRVSDLVTAQYASVVVEMRGGEVAVSHLLEGPTGQAVAACSSAPSANWYVPSGTTRPGTHQWLALFNPFPSDAIATVTFATDDGARTPQAFDAMVIPGGRVTVLDVTSVVTLRDQLATSVSVREGRLIVDQIQTADGSAHTAKGMAVTPAAPRGASVWWFADGPATQGAKIRFLVQNPGSSSAHVKVDVRLDSAGQNGTVSPFEATVQPGAYWTIDLSKDTRVPVGVGFTAVATSDDDRPIVVDRVVTAQAPATPNGFDVALGSPLLSRRWLMPFGSSNLVLKATLIVTNLSATHSVRVSVTTVTDGRAAPLEGTSQVEEIPAGERGGFTVPAGPNAATLSLAVSSSAEVVVEERLTYQKWGMSSPLAVPVVG